MWASLAVGTVLTFLELQPIDPGAEGFEAGMWGVITVSFLVPAAFLVFAARRKNWARFALLLLTIAGIASYLAFWNDMGTEPAWSLASTLLLTAMDVVALFWLFSGAGAEWFRSNPIRPT